MLLLKVQHQIGKDRAELLEKTIGLLRQQTGQWYCQQNKFLFDTPLFVIVYRCLIDTYSLVKVDLQISIYFSD